MRNSTPANGAEGAEVKAGDTVLEAEGVDEAEDAPLDPDIVVPADRRNKATLSKAGRDVRGG
jgi:hypothetical protein